MFVTISFWSLAYGTALSFSDGGVAADVVERAGAAFGLSLLLVPAVFAAAAFVSARVDAPVMVLAGMGTFVGVGLPLLALRNPLAALVTGYAAGAAVSLSREHLTSLVPRVVAVVVVAVVAHVGLWVLPAPTAWLAPALPFTAMGIADLFPRRAAAATVPTVPSDTTASS